MLFSLGKALTFNGSTNLTKCKSFTKRRPSLQEPSNISNVGKLGIQKYDFKRKSYWNEKLFNNLSTLLFQHNLFGKGNKLYSDCGETILSGMTNFSCGKFNGGP